MKASRKGMLPLIYGMTVVGCLIAVAASEWSQGAVLSLVLDVVLVGGFLVVAEHVGLWGPSKQAAVREKPRACGHGLAVGRGGAA